MQLVREINENYRIKEAKDTTKYLNEFKNEDKEYFIVLGLDTSHKVLYREIVSIGTLNSTLIHPREVFKKAIINSCESIICAHNHPSGENQPSNEDIKISESLNKAGELLNIPILDHLIIGTEIVSFKEEIE